MHPPERRASQWSATMARASHSYMNVTVGATGNTVKVLNLVVADSAGTLQLPWEGVVPLKNGAKS